MNNSTSGGKKSYPHSLTNNLDDDNNSESQQQPVGLLKKQLQQQENKLYSHPKKNSNLMPNTRLLTFYVNQPVYKQYAHINLNKSNIKKRIFRQRSITDHMKKHQQQQNNDYKQSINHTEHKNKWKQSVEKYIETKQKSVEKYYQNDEDEIKGYPLMKLSKMNQRLRKIKTTFGDEKPEFIEKLQQQELFSPKPLAMRRSLPSITQKQANTTTTKKKITTKTQQPYYSQNLSPPVFRNQIHIVKVKQVSKQKQKKKLFFKQINQTSDKSQKVIINFIGNYFKQKFTPERRYAYQRSYNQFDENFSVNIS